MKCRYKILKQLTGSERNRLLDEIEKANKTFLSEEAERIRYSVVNNIFKIIVATSNDEFGFGRERIERLLKAINKKMAEVESKEEFWLLTEEKCKRILTKNIYDKYFTDEKFNLRSQL